jgi:hypothetical protein
MDSERKLWQTWAQKFKRWGMNDFLASLLDGFAPVRLLLAQCFYFGAPFFASASNAGWQSFAHMLEDPEEASSFAQYLREEKQVEQS